MGLLHGADAKESQSQHMQGPHGSTAMAHAFDSHWIDCREVRFLPTSGGLGLPRLCLETGSSARGRDGPPADKEVEADESAVIRRCRPIPTTGRCIRPKPDCRFQTKRTTNVMKRPSDSKFHVAGSTPRSCDLTINGVRHAGYIFGATDRRKLVQSSGG